MAACNRRPTRSAHFPTLQGGRDLYCIATEGDIKLRCFPLPSRSRVSYGRYMLNVIWTLMALSAIIVAALTGRLEIVAEASTKCASDAVELALGFVGVMTFWLGLVKVLEAAGFMNYIARLLCPLMRRIFPDVPPEHPAMAMMLMNMAANVTGLDNAATPFGLKAMHELNRLNRRPEQPATPW